MWNDRQERKLPSAILRRQPAKSDSSNLDGHTNSNTDKQRAKPPHPVDPRPTFTGAQDWVHRHRGDIDTVVKLLDLYPNLIQTEGLDPLWDFLKPVLRDKKASTSASKTESRKEEGRTRKKTRVKNHRSKPNRSRQDGAGITRYVYVCDAPVSAESPTSDKSTKGRIVEALSSYCFVRTNPELPASRTELADVLNAVSAADAFLFLLSDGTITNWFSLHLLGIAITHDIPIITVREAGYNLPPTLPLEFEQLEIVRTTTDVVSSPVVPPQRHIRSKSSDTWQETRAKSESQSSGFHSDSENVFREQSSEKAVCSLSDAIRNCFQTSVLYVPNFHDSCISKLFGRLSDYLGDTFLDAENSKTAKHHRVRESQSTDSESNDRLPDITASSVFRSVSSHQTARGKSTDSTPSSDGSHEPPETPSSTDNSSTTPTSPPVKLPPINTASKSEETPTTKEEPPEVSRYIMKSAPNFTNLVLSPPSSPFLETRYLVFPGEPKGSAKKPYLVTFPTDVYGDEAPVEEKRSHSLEKDEDEDEEVEMKLLQMDDDPSFDKIKLDLRQDAICEKSPFSTPLPSARTLHNRGADSNAPREEGKRTTKDLSPVELVPKAAERCDRFRTQNGKIRGIQLAERNKQAQITQPAKKYLRNSSSSWLTATGPFDKKNFKMTKVSLQYGPDGKLPNPLI